jgi:hypothetical protein
LIKALQKAFDRYPSGAPIDIVAINEERRGEIPEDVTGETELLQ